MNKYIKQRAKEIVQNDMPTMLIGTGFFVLISYLTSYITGDIVANVIHGFVATLITACSACFYFRAYNRGHGDLKDIYFILTDKDNYAKIASLMLAMWVINTLVNIASGFAAFIPLIGLVCILIATLIVHYLLRMVWFLFVANTQYPTEYYFKGSSKYMGSQIVAFFVFTISVMFVPAIIEGLLGTVINSSVAEFLCIPLDAYIDLALAGFLSSIIPNEWFDGTINV